MILTQLSSYFKQSSPVHHFCPHILGIFDSWLKNNGDISSGVTIRKA